MSRGNPLLARLRKLADDGASYRRLGAVLLEGEHLCEAWLSRPASPVPHAIVNAAAWHEPRLRRLAEAAAEIASSLPTPRWPLSARSNRRRRSPFSSRRRARRHRRPRAVGRARPASRIRATSARAAQRRGVRLHAGDRADAGLSRSGRRRWFAPAWARTSACVWSRAVDAAALEALDVPLFGTSSHASQRIDAGSAAVAVRAGCSATKGRASPPRSRRAARRCSRSRSPAAASRSTSPLPRRSACTRLCADARLDRAGADTFLHPESRCDSPSRKRCHDDACAPRCHSPCRPTTTSPPPPRGIAGHAHRTPVLTSRTADARARRARVLQVRELPAHGRVQVPRRLQRALPLRRRQRRAGVVAFSSGNHAQAIALAGEPARHAGGDRHAARRARRQGRRRPRATAARWSSTTATAKTARRSARASPRSAA